MTVHVSKLVPANELQIWMRLGLALRPARRTSGIPYYMVPKRPQEHRMDDLTRFVGWVVANVPEEGLLVVQVTQFNHNQRSVVSVPMQADIPYMAILRARRFSTFSIDPGPEVTGDQGGKGLRRPGSVAGFDGTRHRSYRTTEEILLR